MINFSELLLKPQRMPGEASHEAAGPAAESVKKTFGSYQIPVEEAKLHPGSRIVSFSDSTSPGADRFRFLRMRLRELKSMAKLRSIVVTSPLPQDGKSTVTVNLATALAEGGRRTVLLIEADLYHPSVGEILGFQKRPGLAECLEGSLDPVSALRRVEPLGWYFLPAGTARGNPTELLQSDSLPSVLQMVSPYFDWILIDTPPVIPMTDAISLSRQVDTTLLVVRADRTPSETVEEALALLGTKNVLGIVFNGAKGLNRLYSKYYGYYGKK